MRWTRFLLGLAVIGGFLALVVFIKSKSPALTVEPRGGGHSTLTAGTDVPLLLVTPLDSGSSPVGKEVKLVVSEDVKGQDGRTVIEQGAIARATVVKSREGTVMGAVTNKPARLEIKLLDVKASDGSTITLQTTEGKEVLEFDQANTKMDGNLNLVDAVTDPKAREAFAGLAKQILTGEGSDQGTKSQAQLKELADRYGLKDTQALLKDSKSNNVAGILESVQKGDIKGLSGVDLMLAVRAVGEIVDLGSGIDKSLRGIFKGNNIHAKTGLIVKSQVTKSAKVKQK